MSTLEEWEFDPPYQVSVSILELEVFEDGSVEKLSEISIKKILGEDW